jgi:hypothetical protein
LKPVLSEACKKLFSRHLPEFGNDCFLNLLILFGIIK